MTARPAYDIVVVGAGPAGSTAAGHLARAGLSVLLADRAVFPRDKTCGDYIGPECAGEMTRLGISSEEGYPINHWRTVHWPMRAGAVHNVDVPGGSICPRRRFDDHLRRHALSLGAHWLDGYLVKHPVLEGGHVVGVSGVHDGTPLTLRAGLVIAAEGAASYLARRMGLTSLDSDCVLAAGRAYFEGVSGLEDAAELYFRPDMGLQYGWVFPVEDGVANVGVIASFRQCRLWQLNLRSALNSFLETQDGLEGRFKTARQAAPFRGAEIRAGRIGSPTHAPGILFVGDAAGAAEPYAGEGIREAMVTGRLAAETATEALERHDTSAEQLAGYSRKIDESLGDLYRERVAQVRAEVPLFRALHSFYFDGGPAKVPRRPGSLTAVPRSAQGAIPKT